MRLTNRLLATLLGTALLAGGGLVAMEIFLGRAVGRDRPWILPYDNWYADALDTRWSGAGARIAFSALVAAGLILVVLQVFLRRPAALPLTPHAGAAPAWAARQSLKRSLRQVATGVDGVAAARVHLSDGNLRVKARTNRTRAGDLSDQLTAALRGRLARIGLDPEPEVSVRVEGREDS